MPKKKNNKNNNIEEMEAIKSFNTATEKEKEDFIIFFRKTIKIQFKKVNLSKVFLTLLFKLIRNI